MTNEDRRRYIASVYEAYADIVRVKLKSLGFRGTTLDDLMQEVFLVAARRAEEIPSHVGPWLLVVAHRKAANYRRRLCHREELIDGAALETIPAASMLTEFLQLELDALPRADRDLLIRYHFHGDTVAELARELRLSPSGVHSRLQAARKRLRENARDEDAQGHES